MTINTPESKTAKQKFDENFEEIAKKYWIKDFEELKSKDLIKEDIKNLINEYNITWEDKYNLMDSFYEMNEEKIKRTAILWAKAAIIMRNLSHNLWEIALKDDDFDEFADFCGVDKSEIKWKNKLQTLFLKDSEKMENHNFNIIYKKLRKEWKSPYEAIINLPRWDETLSWWNNESPLAKSNNEVMEGSKMWSTKYCTWRVNTILWIVALNEWIDYVNKHFKYAEVLKDWLSDIMDEVPNYNRDESYLNETLNYEDPHQMLIFIDDDWKEFEIDTNQIVANQFAFWTLTFDNVVKKFDWNVWEVAYEMYYLNYINEELRKNKNKSNREKIIKMLEMYNERVWWSETITKWLIAIAINSWDEELEKKYKKKLQELWEKYSCIRDKFSYHIAIDSEEDLKDFVHKKYWSQFTINDILSQYK